MVIGNAWRSNNRENKELCAALCASSKMIIAGLTETKFSACHTPPLLGNTTVELGAFHAWVCSKSLWGLQSHPVSYVRVVPAGDKQMSHQLLCCSEVVNKHKQYPDQHSSDNSHCMVTFVLVVFIQELGAILLPVAYT